VVTIAERAASTTHQMVDRASETHFEAFDAGRQRVTIVRLDQQMNVLVLHGVMNDAHEPAAIGATQRTFDGRETALTP